MTTRDEFEKLVLLKSSGEASPEQLEQLKAYLADHPEAAAYQDALTQVTAAVRQAPCDDQPGHQVIQHILEEAEKTRRTTGRPMLHFPAWLGALAALLALTLGIGILIYSNATSPTVSQQQGSSPDPIETYAWADGIDEEIATLNSMLTTTQADWDDTYVDTEDLDPEELARELIELENLNI